jgi:predicted MFS family arabinose efflux permease
MSLSRRIFHFNAGMFKKISESYRQSYIGLSRETWLLSTVVLINRCGYMAVPFMSMYITQNLHRSIADAGLIITLFGAGSVIGAIAGGYLADRIGFRAVQIISLVISGLLFILFAYIDTFFSLCLLTTVLGLFVEAFKPANNSAIAAYSSAENLTRSYALNRLATNIGFGFGTSVGGVLAAINYKLLFWVDGVVYTLAGILILILLPNGSMQQSPSERDTVTASAVSPWKDSFFIRFIGMVTLYMTAFIMIFRILPVFWKEQMYIGEATIGILMGMNGLIIALFEMVIIQALHNRRPDFHYIIAGVLCTVFAFISLLLPGLPALLAGMMAVMAFTMGEMLTLPYISTIVISRATQYNRGKYSAVYSLSWAIAQVVGPASGGIIAARWGYDALWMTLILLCLLSATGFHFLYRNRLSIGSLDQALPENP